MPTYKIEFSRDWTEQGEMEIEADSEEEARDIAQEALSSSDTEITWHSDNMSLESQCVESVEEVEQ